MERATADAVARLYAQLVAERVDGMPVAEIVDRVGGRQVVMAGLERAQQIGGPRELADGVVQVSLEMEGARAADLIVSAVNASPEKSPIPPQRLANLLSAWRHRSFGTTGDNLEPNVRRQGPRGVSSAQTQAAPLSLPEAPPEWSRDAHTAAATAPAAGTQLRTARAAEKSARAALREQLVALKLDGSTLGTAGRDATQAVDLVVAAAKISGVDYRADGSVEARVTIDGQQLWQTLQMVARH